MPTLKRIFHIDTENFLNTNINRFSQLSQKANEYEYSNRFNEMLIYREPSFDSLKQVENNILNQDNHSITNIQFTSGTTGKPKAAALTHRNLINNSLSLSKRMNYSSLDKILMPVPFYHTFGMVMGNLAALNGGSSIVLASPNFDPKKCLEVATKYECNTVYGVPTMFFEMVKVQKSENFDLSKMEKSVIAGSICPEQLLRDKSKYLNITDVRVAYGMTETSPISFMVKKDDPLDKKFLTVGSIFPNIEAKIIDSDGKIVPIGKKGELATKGIHVMKEYYNDKINTEKNIIDGWMMTGDLGMFDEDGFLSIEGRLKDLIIRGGENISPKEIEEIILKLPQVDNVQVIGVPDPKYQEEVCALVKINSELSKKDLLDYLKPQLSHFKIPTYLLFVDSFPITVTGKPQKFEMRKNWIELVKNLSQKEILQEYGLKNMEKL